MVFTQYESTPIFTTRLVPGLVGPHLCTMLRCVRKTLTLLRAATLHTPGGISGSADAPVPVCPKRSTRVVREVADVVAALTA